MVACRKVVVFGLVVLIGSFPVLATVDPVLQVPSSHLSPSIPLPAGKELGDDELLETEGELIVEVLAVLGLMGWGALTGWVLWECRDHPGLLIAAGAVGTAGGGIIGSYLGGGGGEHEHYYK